MTEFTFYFVAAFTIASAWFVVSSKNLVYSAVALLFSFFGVAGLYVFLYADFLAATQIMVYVGGILVLIVFGVMLTNRISSTNLSQGNRNRILAGMVSLAIFAILFSVNSSTNWKLGDGSIAEGTTAGIGRAILTEYLLPFEVASVLLLAALIGAALLARKEKNTEVENG